MTRKITNAMVRLWFLCFLSPHGLAMDIKNVGSEAFIKCFSLEQIQKIVSKNEAILRAAFPEDAFSGWHYKAEDPQVFFKDNLPLKSYYLLNKKILEDTKARQVCPLITCWLKIHRQLHEVILDTAIRAAVEKLKPTKSEVKQWVRDYISFYILPMVSEPGAPRLTSPYNVFHYSYLSDKCPDWLKPELEKFSNQYQPLYQRLEKTRNRLDWCKRQEHIDQVANTLLIKHGYYSLMQLYADVVEVLPNNSKLPPAKYFAKIIINELRKCFKFNNITAKNYNFLIVDKRLAVAIIDHAETVFVEKERDNNELGGIKEYRLNKAQLRQVITAYLLTRK